MKKLAMIIASGAMLSAFALAPTAASAGCYRVGLTGYHWYRYCAGPRFIYPHHRHCNRHGYCWYH